VFFLALLLQKSVHFQFSDIDCLRIPITLLAQRIFLYGYQVSTNDEFLCPGQGGDVGQQCPSVTWAAGSCPAEGTGSHWPDDRSA